MRLPPNFHENLVGQPSPRFSPRRRSPCRDPHTMHAPPRRNGPALCANVVAQPLAMSGNGMTLDWLNTHMRRYLLSLCRFLSKRHCGMIHYSSWAGVNMAGSVRNPSTGQASPDLPSLWVFSFHLPLATLRQKAHTKSFCLCGLVSSFPRHCTSSRRCLVAWQHAENEPSAKQGAKHCQAAGLIVECPGTRKLCINGRPSAGRSRC